MKKKKYLLALASMFLPMFMLMIFGPAEVFVKNIGDFNCIYKEFAVVMYMIAIAICVIYGMLVFMLPDKIFNIINAVVIGMGVGSYVQLMFFNGKMDSVGVTPEGYIAKGDRATVNIIVWIAIVLICLLIAVIKTKVWSRISPWIVGMLIGIQIPAYISVLMTAPDACYERTGGKYILSGEEQYIVSADENVVVFILDFFANKYADSMLEQYPDAVDFLHDFTYYDNNDCVYFGTFPSLAHMMSGVPFDFETTTAQWLDTIWDQDVAKGFYNGLHKSGYKVNMYTNDTNFLVGNQGIERLKGYFDNIENTSNYVDVDYMGLSAFMTKISAYRIAPDFFKHIFNVDAAEQLKTVKLSACEVKHENYDFYEGLCEQGLTVDEKNKYFIGMHVMGPHIWSTGADGHYKEDATCEETCRGVMLAVEEYLNQMKKLGVYDNSTIIITSDHGEQFESQTILYVKKAGEQHETMFTSSKPVSHNELMGTMSKAAGLSGLGLSYDDIPDEPRERTVYFRWYDPRYKVVPWYMGGRDGSENVFYGLTYTGDRQGIIDLFGGEPSVIVQMVDSYF